MQIYFIIATIDGRENNLDKLIKSIFSNFSYTSKKLIIIKQSINSKPVISNFINFIDVIYINKFGASNARNIGLDYLYRNFIVQNKDLITFPDDDCYYNFSFSKILLDNLNEFDIIFGDIRDPNDQFRMGSEVYFHRSFKFSFVYINCPSFFIKSENIKNIRFDNLFGPGAKYFAAEETKFLFDISLNNTNIKSLYNKQIKIFHPYEKFNPDKNYNYSFAQGKLFKIILSKLSFIQIISFAVIILRPFAGFIFSYNNKKREYYKTRLNGIKNGFLS